MKIFHFTLYLLPFLLNINGNALRYKIAFVTIFISSLLILFSPLFTDVRDVDGTDENGSEGKLAVKTSPC